MSNFPQTAEALKAQGYKFSGYGNCRDCHEDIQWWETPQKKLDGTPKKIPLNNDYSAHFKNCEGAKEREPPARKKDRPGIWGSVQSRDLRPK